MKNYTIDHASATITCTKAFYEKASIFGTPECGECQKLRAAFPDYTFAIRVTRSNESRRSSNKNLTFVNMVRYIVSKPGGLDKLVDFAKLRNLSDQKGGNYKVVKDWFLSNYPAYLLEGVTADELEQAKRFIPASKARDLLNEFASCETVEEIKDVIDSHFPRSENVLPMDMAS